MNKAKPIVMTAVLTAVYAVISQLVIPFPSAPLTLQCFGISLGAFVFGWRTSLASVLLYIGLGAIGLPVFSGFRGGIDAVIGPTGGFIWGFVILGLACGAFNKSNKAVRFGASCLGLAVCHLLGVLQFGFVTGTAFAASFLSVSAPYIVKDVLLMWVALSLSAPISAAILRRK